MVSGAQSFFTEDFGLDDAAVQIAVASVSVGALATAVAPTFAIFLVVREDATR